MNIRALRHIAKLLRELHADGTLVLPNAWDAASAAAWSLGRPDGELLPRADLVAAIEWMATAIDVPLTADVEAGYGGTEEEVAETVTDCLFVPGLADLAVLESLVARSPLPISASTGPGRPTVAQRRAAGVRRVSVGPALTQAAYAVTRQLAGELLSAGQLTTESPGLDDAWLNSLFSAADLVEG